MILTSKASWNWIWLVVAVALTNQNTEWNWVGLLVIFFVLTLFCVGFFNSIVYCFECVCPCVYPVWCSSTQCECGFDAICQSDDIACVLECNIAAMLYQSEMTVSIDQCLQYFSLSLSLSLSLTHASHFSHPPCALSQWQRFWDFAPRHRQAGQATDSE